LDVSAADTSIERVAAGRRGRLRTFVAGLALKLVVSEPPFSVSCRRSPEQGVAAGAVEEVRGRLLPISVSFPLPP